MSNAQKPHKEEEPLDYLYMKTIHCPVCDAEFMDFAVRKSKLRLIDADTDFKNNYHVIDPNHYEVMLCSFCGYAALQNYFTRISSRQQDMIQTKVSPNYRPVEYPIPLSLEHVIARYKQALVCANAMEAKASQKGITWLKMAWAYRGHDEKSELACLKGAFMGLKEAYSTENFPLGSMDEPTTKYIMGELARRLGDYEEALRLIGSVIVSRGIQSSLKDRAQNVKELIKEAQTPTAAEAAE